MFIYLLTFSLSLQSIPIWSQELKYTHLWCILSILCCGISATAGTEIQAEVQSYQSICLHMGLDLLDLLTCRLIQASPTGASAPSGFEQHSSSSDFDQQLRSAISMRNKRSAPGLEIDVEMEPKRPPEASRRHLGGTSEEPGVLESHV